jgi:hypothetical protein
VFTKKWPLQKKNHYNDSCQTNEAYIQVKLPESQPTVLRQLQPNQTKPDLESLSHLTRSIPRRNGDGAEPPRASGVDGTEGLQRVVSSSMMMAARNV